MKKEFTKMDYFFAFCMLICLLSYIGSCFLKIPLDTVKDLIFYFGVGLGLTGGGTIANNLKEKNSEGENKTWQE